MVDLRETYQALIEIQRHPDYSRADFQELLSKLNRDYDSLCKSIWILECLSQSELI